MVAFVTRDRFGGCADRGRQLPGGVQPPAPRRHATISHTLAHQRVVPSTHQYHGRRREAAIMLTCTHRIKFIRACAISSWVCRCSTETSMRTSAVAFFKNATCRLCSSCKEAYPPTGAFGYASGFPC